MLRKVCSRCVSRKVQTVDALTLGSAGYALARLFLQEIRSFVALSPRVFCAENNEPCGYLQESDSRNAQKELGGRPSWLCPKRACPFQEGFVRSRSIEL